MNLGKAIFRLLVIAAALSLSLGLVMALRWLACSLICLIEVFYG